MDKSRRGTRAPELPPDLVAAVSGMLWEREGSDESGSEFAARVIRYVLDRSASVMTHAPADQSFERPKMRWLPPGYGLVFSLGASAGGIGGVVAVAVLGTLFRLLFRLN